MKKEFKKKLSLNKQTISTLNQSDLFNVKGGQKVPTGTVCSELTCEDGCNTGDCGEYSEPCANPTSPLVCGF